MQGNLSNSWRKGETSAYINSSSLIFPPPKVRLLKDEKTKTMATNDLLFNCRKQCVVFFIWMACRSCVALNALDGNCKAWLGHFLQCAGWRFLQRAKQIVRTVCFSLSLLHRCVTESSYSKPDKYSDLPSTILALFHLRKKPSSPDQRTQRVLHPLTSAIQMESRRESGGTRPFCCWTPSQSL